MRRKASELQSVFQHAACVLGLPNVSLARLSGVTKNMFAFFVIFCQISATTWDLSLGLYCCFGPSGAVFLAQGAQKHKKAKNYESHAKAR